MPLLMDYGKMLDFSSFPYRGYKKVHNICKNADHLSLQIESWQKIYEKELKIKNSTKDLVGLLVWGEAAVSGGKD